MHDWSLLSITIDWVSGEAAIQLVSPAGPKELKAHGIADIQIPRAFPWGPSRSINASHGPAPTSDGTATLKIEMQSGDTIKIVAKSFTLP
jgi:hypothetical protein